jgi:hypothetical protein
MNPMNLSKTEASLFDGAPKFNKTRKLLSTADRIFSRLQS